MTSMTNYKTCLLFTGYLEQGLMVKDSKMLRKQYLKSASWRYDFISLIPTDIAYYWWRPGTCVLDVSIRNIYSNKISNPFSTLEQRKIPAKAEL